jgi:hypothetical protein
MQVRVSVRATKHLVFDVYRADNFSIVVKSFNVAFGPHQLL